jgi:hypothetical protein
VFVCNLLWVLIIPKYVQEGPGPRAAKGVRNYAEDIESGRDGKRRRGEGKEKIPKRGPKATNSHAGPSEALDGAAARAVSWRGGNLTKKEANSFIKAVRYKHLILPLNWTYLLSSPLCITLSLSVRCKQ